MSVHLIGGGDPAAPGIFEGFLGEVSARATIAGRAEPRIAIIAVGADATAHAEKLRAALATENSVDASITTVDDRMVVPATALAEVDGVLVGGGLTPAVRESLEPRFGELRRLVASGLPYAGFSAGAAIAAESALIGGWCIGGVPVAPSETAEDLDELTVAPGIGLVDVAIDVHAAQWGTLSRLVAAVEAGLVAGGLAIDEDTALIVGEGGLRVAGRGSVWRVLPGEQGVIVGTIGA